MGHLVAENGSLAHVRKRFGNFSEALCAIYMGQARDGVWRAA